MVFLLQFSMEGGIHNGKDNDECAGISSTDEHQPAKGVQAGKDTGISGNSCWQQNSYSGGSIQGMAAQNIDSEVKTSQNITKRNKTKKFRKKRPF